jgi:hypothetical protein
MEVTDGVTAIGEKRDLLVELVTLGLEHLTQAPRRLRVQGLHKSTALAGGDILRILSMKGQDALAHDDFALRLFRLQLRT